MIQTGKKNVLGVMINVIDYSSVVDLIINAARSRKPLSLTALAVHGLMTGVFDRELLYRLNCLDIVVPDGQPVRWALNWLYGAGLHDRVYGPNLTLAVCMRAEKEGLAVFFYGSTSKILSQLKRNLLRRFPHLIIAGMDSSKFRILSREEKTQVVDNICKSGASIVFVGLGCPRQEVWTYEFRDSLSIPLLAVGAAFPFLAGIIPQAPRWMQDRGLEWFFRLSMEPRRLWSRYLLLNPIYLFLLMLQAFRICRFRGGGRPPTHEMRFG
jgi:exopolysaccharide biosynthesis WecB/TagA/CpsF family protein